jgi:predicted DNA-binding transcriptional regulator YafY
MEENDLSRLSRLTAIVTQLQTKRLTTAPELAQKFGVSVRTIYRDIRALEASGIPIFTEEGKGYSLVEGYRLPPVSFTESEANALITAAHLVQLNKDQSFIDNYLNAIAKVKAVLRSETKDNLELLTSRIHIWQGPEVQAQSQNLSTLQLAITHFNLVKMTYKTVEKEEVSQRMIEPFALFTRDNNNWKLVAWCRLREDFRIFRIDKIVKLDVLNEKFEPHKLTIEEYYEKYIAPHFNP